jgi:ribosomal protein S7
MRADIFISNLERLAEELTLIAAYNKRKEAERLAQATKDQQNREF